MKAVVEAPARSRRVAERTPDDLCICIRHGAFGAFLDPVADKLMVAAVLIVLVKENPSIWLMLCALIIIGREIWISALREWMSGIGHRGVVAVLDSRLRTARYGGFLTRSMPALWPTTKPDVVRAALRRLALRSDAPGEE